MNTPATGKKAGEAPFSVLIPARLASTRLPDKPLADIAGLPMVVRVAKQAALSMADQVVVATDSERIAQTCEQHHVRWVITDAHHPSGSDRLAQACEMLKWPDDMRVVNVQGDEPLIDPELINAVARQLQDRPDCVMSTAAHALTCVKDFLNPNVVKVVMDRRGTALYFSRAAIPWWRDGMKNGEMPTALPQPAPLRHVGIYGYRVGFLRQFPQLEVAPLEQIESLEQLRVLWHGERIAVYISKEAPAAGVDTQEDLDRVRLLLDKT
jgi:3-deoxy-manno-octulosonate cytidylyltransferase (CMP-KDO synthetase)